MHLNVDKIFKKVRITLLFVWTIVILAAGSYFIFDKFLQNTGEELLNGWLQSNSLSIQEGNLISALSSQHRVLVSSKFISGVFLLESFSGELLSGSKQLAGFGEKPFLARSKLELPSGLIFKQRLGLFQYQLFYRFVDKPFLVVVFIVNPVFVKIAFLIFVIFVGVLVGFFLILHANLLRKEGVRRLELVRQAMIDLTKRKNPSLTLKQKIPEIEGAWVELEGYLYTLLETINRAAKLTAIARTTQTLAHDVRKPFSLLKVIIDTAEGISDPNEVKSFFKNSLPEVQQAIASVNGMISDVLEIGSEAQPISESTNLETLIESTLLQSVRIYPNCEFEINYHLQHKHKINVDTLKISRVFSNIVGNALQAMNAKGNMWFHTIEITENKLPFVQVCIGNSGTFIEPEHLPKLFDAFYTSGKKGGTGLGLAIAQKIVNAHGGKIWCESDVKKGVEFYFTLPCSIELSDERTILLTRSSAEINLNIAQLQKEFKSQSILEADPLEVTLEKEIIHLASENKKPLNILIVDDEALYRNSIVALVGRSESLKQHIILDAAKNSNEAHLALLKKPNLMILDVDLGAASQNGYEVLKQCRQDGFKGTVCIHSNRGSASDQRVALDAGADAVLPKPMSRPHLLKLILQAAKNASIQIKNLNEIQNSTESTKSLPEIAVVDDSKILLRTWKIRLSPDAIVHTFACPRDFREHVAQNSDFLNRLALIIIDFTFDNEPGENGITFAQSLKPIFNKPMILCSESEFKDADIALYFEAAIPKMPSDLKTLMENMESWKLD